MGARTQCLKRALHVGRVAGRGGVLRVLRELGVWGSRPATREGAREFRQALEELGTTYIKLGQLLASRPGLLPDVYIEELEQLVDRISPVPFQDINGVIQDDSDRMSSRGSIRTRQRRLRSRTCTRVSLRADARRSSKCAVPVSGSRSISTLRSCAQLLSCSSVGPNVPSSCRRAHSPTSSKLICAPSSTSSKSLSLPTSFALVGKTLAQADSIARVLHPELDPVALLEEDALEVMLSEAERRLEPNQFFAWLYTQLEPLAQMPRRVGQVLGKLETGKLETGTFKVGVAPTDLTDLQEAMCSTANRIGGALIVSALLVASALLGRVHDLRWYAFAGFCAAFALGLHMVWKIIRTPGEL